MSVTTEEMSKVEIFLAILENSQSGEVMRTNDEVIALYKFIMAEIEGKSATVKAIK